MKPKEISFISFKGQDWTWSCSVSVHGRIHPFPPSQVPPLLGASPRVQRKDGETFVCLMHSQVSPRSLIPEIQAQRGLSSLTWAQTEPTGFVHHQQSPSAAADQGNEVGDHRGQCQCRAQLGGKARPSRPALREIRLIKWTVRPQKGWK